MSLLIDDIVCILYTKLSHGRTAQLGQEIGYLAVEAISYSICVEYLGLDLTFMMIIALVCIVHSSDVLVLRVTKLVYTANIFSFSLLGFVNWTW